ncbi:hypothetical protein AN216_13445 [Streptomyces oceani]|uniref:Glycerophosphoryl diester phosphodiesterase membrane domain-containing protein n=1 Tax=Streptomyces oceani TaxID=1075402 RepID=A0A1E7KGT2_9ACTN|nr:hypothetical protein AN216_13445 [Streptomyces oceani]
MLGGAVSSARAHWRTVLGVVVPVAVLVQCASTTAAGIWMRDNPGLEALQGSRASTAEILDALRATLGGAAVELLATLMGTVMVTAMLTVVVSRAVLGRAATFTDVWRDARPRIGRLLGLTLLVLSLACGAVIAGTAPALVAVLVGATSGGGLLILLGGAAGCVAAVWLWVRYCLAAPALMLEKGDVRTALRRSATLVRGDWWRVLGVQLLAMVVAFVISYVVQIPASAVAAALTGESVTGAADLSVSWGYLAVMGVGAAVASVLTLPLNAGVTALLYMDQRIRREALDLKLAQHTER